MRLSEERLTPKRFVLLALGVLAVVWTLGYLPARRFGDASVVAMFVGGLLALVASLVGTVPFVLRRGRPAVDKVPAALGAIALRLAVVLVLALAAVWSGLVDRKALLIWVVVCHFGLLIADTLFAMAEFKADE